MKKGSQPLQSYSKPHLIIDRIEVEEKAKKIKLFGRGRTLEIDFEGDAGSGTELLHKLKDSDNEIWKSLFSNSDQEFQQTVEMLDKYGWIEDDDSQGQQELALTNQGFDKIVRMASDWLDKAANELNKKDYSKFETFRLLLISFLNDTVNLLRELEKGKRSVVSVSNLPSVGNETMASKALVLTLRSWQKTSPKSLLAFGSALLINARKIPPVEKDLLEMSLPLPDLSGIEDIDAIRNQVWTASCLLLQSLNINESSQYNRIINSLIEPDSGINTVIQAEGLAELLVSSLDQSELLTVLNHKEYAHKCGCNIFLHQHFITIRYLESILSFLQYRMRTSLRNVGFQYLLEEIGHDVHEKEACIRLGLTENDILKFSPLSFFEVYSEIIAYLSELVPLSFCLSVIVAEGMPGQKKIITDKLAAQGIDDPDLAIHTELDLELNHTYYPRELMKNIRWISGKERLEAIQNFLFVLELSQLGWTQIARYAANSKLPLVPIAFQATPEMIINNYK